MVKSTKIDPNLTEDSFKVKDFTKDSSKIEGCTEDSSTQDYWQGFWIFLLAKVSGHHQDLEFFTEDSLERNFQLKSSSWETFRWKPGNLFQD